MENQTNINPPAQAPQGGSNSSGANTVLLVVVIILLVAGGYWWYTHRAAKAPADNNPSINVDVNLPSGDTNTDTTAQ